MSICTRVGILALLALSLISSTVFAQEARGTIQGRVIDTSGFAVPGASVEVLNTATGVVSPTTSNEQGSYRVPFLIPGTYRVTVSLQGFSTFVNDGIELHVADVLAVDATLKVGSIAESDRSSTRGASRSCPFAKAVPSSSSSSRRV